MTDDLKINDEGHCGPKITDEDHRPITVKMGAALGPHVSAADNSSTDLTDEDVSSVDDGDEADDDDGGGGGDDDDADVDDDDDDDDDDDEDGAGNLVVDDEPYEDVQEVIDSFQSSKRERSTGSSSDSCDDSSHTYIHTYILYLNTEGTISIKILTIYKRRKK